jgi:serine/threonine-protein kinase RsbW
VKIRAAGGAELERHLLSLRVEDEVRYRARLVYEELIGNALRYVSPADGRHHLRLEAAVQRDQVELALVDDGIPFDPTAEPAPRLARSLEEASIGGRGIAMVRRVATRFAYRREGDRNRVEVAIPRGRSAGRLARENPPAGPSDSLA